VLGPCGHPSFMNSTKRALALVAGASAVLAASTLGATSAKAQLTTLLQSGIQRPNAGVDIGTNTMAKGTITYSNSAGASDNFSVGTTTAINANASASSTSDYQVTSTASFDMGNNAPDGIGGGLSVISQQIGKSSSQSASQSLDTSTAQAYSESAATTATAAVNEKYETRTESASNGGGNSYWWWSNNRWNQFSDSETATAEQQYEAAYEAEYNSQYDTAFSSQVSAKAASDGADGTISGEFVKNAGSSSTSNYQSSQYRDASSGDIVDTSAFTFETSTEAGASEDDFVATSTTDVNTTLNVTREQIQHSDFTQTADTTNTVTVKGINSANQIIADDGAEFTSTISKIDTTTDSGDSGTASGSAAGAVSTNASASATSSSFISSFVQAY
jgi:hypothetical protein